LIQGWPLVLWDDTSKRSYSLFYSSYLSILLLLYKVWIKWDQGTDLASFAYAFLHYLVEKASCLGKSHNFQGVVLDCQEAYERLYFVHIYRGKILMQVSGLNEESPLHCAHSSTVDLRLFLKFFLYRSELQRLSQFPHRNNS